MAGTVADVAGWRAGLAAVGVVSLACAVAFRLLLPPATAPAPSRPRPRDLRGHAAPATCATRACRRLFGIAFVLMGRS